MTASPVIVRAGARDVAWVADLIARAFQDLPPAAWLVPEASARQRVLAGQFRILVDHAVEYGEVHLTQDQAGVAAWVPRPTPLVPPPRQYGARLELACGRWTDRFLVLDDLFDHHHPTAAHHHLVFLAVEPERQGQGIGSRLLDHHHDRLDALGMPAYLEASSPANRVLYRRHGYRPREPFHLPGGGPPFWPMWRDSVTG